MQITCCRIRALLLSRCVNVNEYGEHHCLHRLCGLISFLSPCVLPLVPGYISIISGFSLDQLKIETRKPSILRTVFGNSVMFILGFSITFISLGASASWLGQVLLSKMTLLYKIAGVTIIIFGLHLLGIFRINLL